MKTTIQKPERGSTYTDDIVAFIEFQEKRSEGTVEIAPMSDPDSYRVEGWVTINGVEYRLNVIWENDKQKTNYLTLSRRGSFTNDGSPAAVAALNEFLPKLIAEADAQPEFRKQVAITAIRYIKFDIQHAEKENADLEAKIADNKAKVAELRAQMDNFEHLLGKAFA